jgi:hypothetical protein
MERVVAALEELVRLLVLLSIEGHTLLLLAAVAVLVGLVQLLLGLVFLAQAAGTEGAVLVQVVPGVVVVGIFRRLGLVTSQQLLRPKVLMVVVEEPARILRVEGVEEREVLGALLKTDSLASAVVVV